MQSGQNFPKFWAGSSPLWQREALMQISWACWERSYLVWSASTTLSLLVPLNKQMASLNRSKFMFSAICFKFSLPLKPFPLVQYHTVAIRCFLAFHFIEFAKEYISIYILIYPSPATGNVYAAYTELPYQSAGSMKLLRDANWNVSQARILTKSIISHGFCSPNSWSICLIDGVPITATDFA